MFSNLFEGSVPGWRARYWLHRETTLTSAGGTDIFVARYDRDGNLKWAESAGGAGADEGRGIAVSDLSGEVFVAGGFQGTATFDLGGANETTLTSAGLQDIFVAQYRR